MSMVVSVLYCSSIRLRIVGLYRVTGEYSEINVVQAKNFGLMSGTRLLHQMEELWRAS